MPDFPFPTAPLPAARLDALLAALTLQRDWGVDCTLDETPIDRFGAASPQESRAPRPAPPAPAESQGATPADATTLAEFCARLAALRDHPLARTATHAVMPIHVEGSRLMVIGETPQADEDRSGIVLSGADHAMFDRMIGAIGLDRAALSLAPAIPWRPPGGREVSPAEMQFCRPLLHRAIALCRPERLLLLGLTPARMMLGDAVTLAQIRGKWREVEIPGLGSRPALVTRHPMQLPASPRARQEAWRDLLLLAETLDSPPPAGDESGQDG